MVGNIVQGNRLASAQGRDMGIVDEESDSARKVNLSLFKPFLNCLKSFFFIINSFVSSVEQVMFLLLSSYNMGKSKQ